MRIRLSSWLYYKNIGGIDTTLGVTLTLSTAGRHHHMGVEPLTLASKTRFYQNTKAYKTSNFGVDGKILFNYNGNLH